MYFCYFDESGDSGREKSPTSVFALAAVLVRDREWLRALRAAAEFRRHLSRNFGIPAKTELKAFWLVHGKNNFRRDNWAFRRRMSVYKEAARFQANCGFFRTFAVAVEKSPELEAAPGDIAWQLALEQINRFGEANNEMMHVLPDEGHNDLIKRKIRAMHRIDYARAADGGVHGQAENIVEDPSDRKSRESHFVQFADLNAYAAVRKIRPGQNIGGELWDALGNSRVTADISPADGPAGIKIYRKNP